MSVRSDKRRWRNRYSLEVFPGFTVGNVGVSCIELNFLYVRIGNAQRYREVIAVEFDADNIGRINSVIGDIAVGDSIIVNDTVRKCERRVVGRVGFQAVNDVIWSD